MISPRYPFFMWMPTRSTRLMSYDLRGDPHALMVYPSYYSWMAPFNVYKYGPSVYNITGQYIIPKSNNLSRKYKIQIKKVENRVKGKEN